MTTKTLAMVFGIAAVVAAGLLAAMDHVVVASEEPTVIMPAADPFVVTASVIALAQPIELAARR